jgi:o-succinylbenzoate synthase
MTIVNVQWHPYRVPFKIPFSTAHGLLKARTGIIVEVRTEEGVTGVGEIAPLPEFKGSTLAQASVMLPSLVEHLKGKTLHEALDIVAATAGVINLAPTTCGMEIALFDAWGKVEHRSVGSLLCENVVGLSIPINAVIASTSQEMAVMAARQAVNDGYTCIKLKVGMAQSVHEEVERVAAVRDTIGPKIRLRLDANEAWDIQQALAVLSCCVPYDIEYIEQPVKADNLEAMRMLCRSVPIPIAADEAISNLSSARRVLENEAAAVLIVKPQLAGGLRVGQQIVQEAARYGVQCVITSSIETGIGIAATLHLAAATPTITQACGLSTLNMLVDDLLVEDLLIQDGYMTVPTDNGLGVTLDREALELYKGNENS